MGQIHYFNGPEHGSAPRIEASYCFHIAYYWVSKHKALLFSNFLESHQPNKRSCDQEKENQSTRISKTAGFKVGKDHVPWHLWLFF